MACMCTWGAVSRTEPSHNLALCPLGADQALRHGENSCWVDCDQAATFAAADVTCEGLLWVVAQVHYLLSARFYSAEHCADETCVHS
jgi:hypothetical protein